MGNCRESENGRGAAPDLLGTWRGAGFSVLNWHRPVEEEGVRSRLALIRVTWDACLCQRVARGGQTDRQTIHYIEPLHSRRGLCGHYVYEKGLCGGSWLVVPVNRSLCALGVCHFSVTIGLFYSVFAFDPTRCFPCSAGRDRSELCLHLEQCGSRRPTRQDSLKHYNSKLVKRPSKYLYSKKLVNA